ncbi:MAG: hypothetical protein ACM31G_09745 [Flavobacteriales bacterium]
MKIQKLTVNKASDALIATAEAGVGFAASNAAAKAVNSFVKKPMLSKGLVAASGLAIAIMVPNKHVQAVAGGMAAKQVYDLVKDAVTPHVSSTGILADALEINALPAPSTEAALNRALAGRKRRSMGNPSIFKMGNPVAGAPTLIAG